MSQRPKKSPPPNPIPLILLFLLIVVALAAADVGDDSFGGQQVVFGASFETDGLEDG